MERTEKLLIALIVVLLIDWLAALYCRVKSHDEEEEIRSLRQGLSIEEITQGWQPKPPG